MSNRNTSLLDFLPREPHRQTHLQRRRGDINLLLGSGGADASREILRARDQYALRERLRRARQLPLHSAKKTFVGAATYLVHNILHQLLLVVDAQPPRRNHVGLQHKQHDRILRRARTAHPVAPRVQLRPHDLDVLPQLHHHVRRRLEDHERLAGRRGRHGRQSRGECVGRSGQALVFHDLVRARAEATGGAQRARHGADDHVDFGGVDVLVLSDASAGPA
jgi:hypothetical protein